MLPRERTPDSEANDRPGAGPEELVRRFRALPAVDPRRLREDVDAVVDQLLPGAADIADAGTD